MKHPYRFYAAENYAGSSSSMGFANAWYVLVFDSREHRDNWLQAQSSLTSRKITRRDVSRFTPRPSHSSHRSHLAIIDTGIEAEGLIGKVLYCEPREAEEPWYVERFKL